MEFEEIIERIQKSGYRLTAARKQVIHILCTHSDYLGAYDIHHLLEKEKIHLGVVSIYRVLGMMKSLGLLKSEEFGSSGEKFRLVAKFPHLHHSHQLICSQCGRMEEWAGDCPISGISRKLERDSGYQIEDHWLRFIGLCPHCKNQ